MRLRFTPVTQANREQAEALRIAPSQCGYVESVADCMKEADCKKCWRPVGIYDGEVLIGFAMYGFFWAYFPFGRVWLDRLLIDYRYQGKGYGKATLSELLKLLRNEYHRKKIYLSVVEGNNTAIHLYEKFGFSFTGERDIHGEKVMMHHF